MKTDTIRRNRPVAPVHAPWHCGRRSLPIGNRTLIMGILNVTPDSFSDGGHCADAGMAEARALQMIGEGADLIDIGGESTRPGANPVTVEEEIRRTIPLIAALRSRSSAVLSIDTSKADVARLAVEEGVDVINDVTALTGDPEMLDVVASTEAGVVLMHMQGEPRTMQTDPRYDDVVDDVKAWLADRVEVCLAAGVAGDRIALDPGIGFGKTVEHNLALLRGLPSLLELGCPVLVGLSRKSFLGALTGRGVEHRLAAGLGAHAFAVMQGANILRVHDVMETCDAMGIVDILRTRQL